MRTPLLMTSIVAGLLTPAVASAQTPPPAAAPATAPAAAPAYSTASTDIGTLLDNPATKAVLLKNIPEIVNNDQIAMARSMTLKSIQQYSGDALTDAKLATIDAELAKIPAKK